MIQKVHLKECSDHTGVHSPLAASAPGGKTEFSAGVHRVGRGWTWVLSQTAQAGKVVGRREGSLESPKRCCGQAE